MNTPNLVIAGTNKGGTTSLFRYLALHPEICASQKKETCYFLPIRYGDDLSEWSEYEKLFNHYKSQPYVMEATPGYFEGGKKLAQILKEKLGDDVKIIITLRNPSDRLASFFRYKQSQLQLPEEMTLDEYIEICQKMPISEKLKKANGAFWGIDGGKYMNYLPHWFSVFDPKNVKIIFFDSIAHNPKVVMDDLCQWLDIDPSIYQNSEFLNENKTTPYKHAWIHHIAITTNKKLETLFFRFPNLKNSIRAFYYKFNGDANKNRVLNKENNHNDLFETENIMLAKFLIQQGYNQLPPWLNKSM